ncbi:RNA polymerase sigma factor [Owenweeksia hongkongensis]|uniref:RNA polymerase sigma factor n=1 Tax=Owenweeksia hongkongensis TaxID=253245 RepID=UPI003A926402
MELDSLVRASQKGDKKAHGELYTLLHRKMFGVCLRYASSEAEAQDHLHDGFIHLFKNIKKYAFQGSFEGWARRLFVNLILQKFRSKKLLYATGFEFNETNEVSYEHILEDINAAELLQLITELSPQYKLIFNLYAIEGYSHKEIAEKLEISEGTSKSNLSRARSILQAKVLERFPHCYQMKSNGG